VFVEAVILEVQVDRLRQLGSDPLQIIGAGSSGALQGIAGFNRLPEDLSSIAQALSGSSETTVNVLNTVNVRAFMQFLVSHTDANVLSTPQVLAADNQKAKIVVGENRPFPTGQSQGITGGTLVTIERKDVGVTLELTPQILDDDWVRLELKQEITAIAENVAQTIGSGDSTVPVGPTTTKRSMETTTIAHDEQTLVIGGLMRDNVIINEQKIPLLGDIPWIGWLFKSEKRQTEKLDLLVFLTPHIIKGEVDMVKLNERKAIDVTTLQRENRIEEPSRLKQEVIERLQNGNRPLSSPKPSSSNHDSPIAP
jgi:general secretion pathway protein D